MSAQKPDTKWDDTEIVLHDMTPDTKFVFDRMTVATIDAVDAHAGEDIIDLACGRAIDATHIALRGATVFGLEPSDLMLKKTLEWIEPGKTHPVILLRSLAETLPLRDASFDKLVCKGAIDHFVDVDAALKESARLLKPGGRLIISVANFESLSARLARIYDFCFEKIKGRKRTEHPSYIPPDDHNFKFDLKFLQEKLKDNFEIEMLLGLSLLWCFPGWGAWLRRLAPARQESILKFLDRVARVFPSWSDVLVVSAIPQK
jgi:SAM-dependent methyltransferase